MPNLSLKALLRSLIQIHRIERIYITINYINDNSINQHVTGNANNMAGRDVNISRGGENE
ncbi:MULTISPECIES: hypothetical protein [Rodentibacter]|uniref:hypothetical protein n=1 Tax=Rodentibacter TaxID=1960084 RepID=UPI0009861668|nr:MULTISPECIES: hypothetical protein [Rodentibacter]OOF46744.1 hypothetical protein BKK53_11790 [Rodentibacter trehalosifermentans]OOF89406.1 hypothetical protein BKG94_02090 [Rodentibacter ratti]